MLMRAATWILRRDLLLAVRRPGEAAATLLFFVLVAALHPLAASPRPELLRAAAPGVLWTAALLASMLALPRLFALDEADGTLEQLLLLPQPLALVVLAKSAAHWLVTGLPLVLAAPLLALQFELPPAALPVLAAGLLLGTPTLSLLGAVGAALTLGLRGGGVLGALLVLPLAVPVLVFGAGAAQAALGGLPTTPPLLVLGALLTATLALAPWAAAAALRLALE
jgi:heme exporter protein B